MPYRFFAAIAALLCLAHPTVMSAPLVPARAAIIQEAVPYEMTERDMSVVVFLPDECKSQQPSRICQQFIQLKPEPNSFAYTAQAGLARQRSIAGQVQALPAEFKARRFVMLLDWRMFIDTSQFVPVVSLNGEAVVFDQVGRKVVWHAVVLRAADTGALDTFADSYVNAGALRELGARKGLELMVAAIGGELRALPAGQEGDGKSNLVIFNRRPDEPGRGLDQTHMMTIAPVTPGERKRLWFSLPSNTHIALRLPPGRFEIHDLRTPPIEVEVGSKLLAYRLGTGGAAGPRFAITAIRADEIAQEVQATTNLLVPGAQEDPRRTEQLEWSDIAPAASPAMPVLKAG